MGLFLVWRGLWGNCGIAGRIRLADDADRSKVAPAIDGNRRINRYRWRGRFLASRAGVPPATAETAEAAFLHTVDIEQSNPRLAGLRLRCGKQGIEAVVVVVEPIPPHARPQSTLRTPGQEFQFIGTIIPTGAGIRLPGDATSLVTGPWWTPRELEIKMADGGAPIDGVVALSGLPEALPSLNADCGQKCDFTRS
ncbi:MAG: hypothetical protein M3178_17880 [Pseudomonadota bacterium]|nr:hypothetical protein [Pseudomonadota bacterium]